MKKLSTLLIATCLGLGLSAQENVGINTATPDPSAILDVYSTEMGVLIPRMTTAERDAIASPANGLMVYNTDEATFNFYDGTSWLKVVSNGNAFWAGAGGYAWNTNPGNLGIGTATAEEKLHIYQADATKAAIKMTNTNASFIMGVDDASSQFRVSADTGGTGTPPISIFVIQPDKKVGIGTTDPQHLLHVKSANDAAIKMESSSQSYLVGIDETEGYFAIGHEDDPGDPPISIFVITPDKKVGIGSTTPEFDLVVNNVNGNAPKIAVQQGIQQYVMGMNDTADYFSIGYKRAADGVARMASEAHILEVFMIDSSGRAGVGSIDPNADFNVPGKMKTHEIEVVDPVSGNSFTISSDATGSPSISADMPMPMNGIADFYGVPSTTVNNAWEDVNWNNQRVMGSEFTHTGGTADITYNGDGGYYKITYSLTMKGGAISAQTSEARMRVNGAIVQGSNSMASHNAVLAGSFGNLNKTVIVQLSTGDVINLQVREAYDSGLSTLDFETNNCNMTIEKIAD